MLAKYYAKALNDLLSDKAPEKQEEVLARFFAVVRERGHRKLMRAIVREYERMQKLGSVKQHARVLVARESDKSRFEKDIAAALERVGAKESRIEVDDRVIGGYRIESNEIVVDATYRRQLLELYRALVF